MHARTCGKILSWGGCLGRRISKGVGGHFHQPCGFFLPKMKVFPPSLEKEAREEGGRGGWKSLQLPHPAQK